MLSRIRSYLALWSNPSWVLMDLFSRFFLLRRALRVRRRRHSTVPLYDPRSTTLTGLDVVSSARKLERDGVVSGFSLPERMVRGIVQRASSIGCLGNGQPDQRFLIEDKAQAEAELGQQFSMANYTYVLRRFPEVRTLSEDPGLLALAKRYIGGDAQYVDSRLWWTFAVPPGDADETSVTSFYHYDKDDFGCFRVFFYLTDVDAGAGPHVLFKNSHRRKPAAELFSLRPRSRDQLLRRYGDENETVVTGPAGSGFVLDPFCFHRAEVPSSRHRLMLQLRFAVRDYAIFGEPEPYEPDLALPMSLA